MNALIRKEVRLLLPAWISALVLVVLQFVFLGGFQRSAFTVPSFCFAALLLGLSSFGREFSSGCFSLLLTQPTPRLRVWRTKVALLTTGACSVFFLWVLFCFAWSADVSASDFWQELLGGGLLGFAFVVGGLWTTLLFRQVAAAFWISLLTPAALGIGVAQVAGWLASVLAGGAASALLAPENVAAVAAVAVTVLYSIAGYWLARRLFLRAQDTAWTGGEVSLRFLRRRTAEVALPGAAPRRQPLRALLRKEFHLHSISFLFAGVLLLLHLAAITLRKFGDDSQPHILRDAAKLVWVFWFVLPFILGATAVASERQFGTMDGQLCLPARRRTQFAIKFLSALAAGVVLGGVMPLVLEGFAARLGARSDLLEGSYAGGPWYHPAVLPSLWTFTGALALVSFYASTLTRTTLQALGAAVVCCVLVWVMAVSGLMPEQLVNARLWRGWLIDYTGLPTLAVVLVALSYWNFKRLHQAGQLWRRNLVVLGLWLVLIGIATTAIYHRTWELVMPLEPQHGPARIAGPARVEVCSVAERVFILLPDGRLWARTQSEWVYWGADTAMLRPVAGEFVGGSNWTALAATHQQVTAIQSDGSLWEFFESARVWPRDKSLTVAPKRIGTDSDWKEVDAHGGHFLALKQDGSIWGWGDNSCKQLGEGPKALTKGPVRIGKESDWTAVFASGWKSAAVKRDGSLWMWGGLRYLPDGTRQERMLHQPTPMRWNLPGTNLVSLRSVGYCDLGLYSDGSVQAVGRIPPALLGDPATAVSDEETGWLTGPAAVTPVCINRGESWRAIMLGQSLLTLHADGSLWKQADWWGSRKPPQPKKVSEYSDWVAVTMSHQVILGLAADGTLCSWLASQPDGDPRALLRPTRGPLWTLNIFESAKGKGVEPSSR